MDAKLEKIENSEAYLNIEVDSEKFEEGLEKAYRKIVKQVNIPGFRKGRAPRALVEVHYGKEILYEDALEFVIPEAYEQAVNELNVEAIAQPDFEIVEIEAGKPLKFNAKVAIKPDVELGKLEGIEVSVPKVEVSEEDVNNRLEEMRARYAQMVEKVDEPAELGDNVIIDFEGFVDDVAFEGGKGEDFALELGSNTFIPGFEEQLVGIKSGEEKDVNVTFPEDYQAEELAGQDAVFKVKVKKIETKELRPLDNDFVQEVSEFDTLDELKDDIRKSLHEMSEQTKTEQMKEEVLSLAVEECEIPLPDALVESQLDVMVNQFSQRLSMQGISLEQYLALSNSNMDDFKKELWPQAKKNASINLMLEKIVEEKGIEVTDEEIDKNIKETAERTGLEFEDAKKSLESVMDNVVFQLKLEKAVEYLVANANIKEVEVEKEEIK
ncbi:Cell division trigger factor [Candidatus Syntrophocurvum alkaliphilum]|uniref:Trigger factor n=1 Tax=Candidatus Syntrophocurvum alkaliphilum TaxID=2293317 RepID=A0A6I6DKF7_9FIRM|nr:trigger factor [Candidatus Syntrophocurvum alkaliphilum]QGU00065.1 Cell division trigger factor [Candidatus Syntrophocurvum alkaliphilum]